MAALGFSSKSFIQNNNEIKRKFDNKFEYKSHNANSDNQQSFDDTWDSFYKQVFYHFQIIPYGSITDLFIIVSESDRDGQFPPGAI